MMSSRAIKESDIENIIVSTATSPEVQRRTVENENKKSGLESESNELSGNQIQLVLYEKCDSKRIKTATRDYNVYIPEHDNKYVCLFTESEQSDDDDSRSPANKRSKQQTSDSSVDVHILTATLANTVSNFDKLLKQQAKQNEKMQKRIKARRK